MIRHHPSESLLTQLAAGSLAAGPAVIVSAHVERCARCRMQLRELEALGGVLLEQIDPVPLSADALTRTLAAIDAQARAPITEGRSGSTGRLRARLPEGVAWPRSLIGSSTTAWRHLTIGVRWCRVTLSHEREGNVYLLRVAAGRGLPMHSHRGHELTQVLYGSFEDGAERFGVGDFEQADGATHHRPVVSMAGECICLAAVDGRTRFDGPLARAMGSLLRL